MSESFFPIVGADPPVDSSSYFETISSLVEFDLKSEANIINIWSDANEKVTNAVGDAVPVGSIYLPCEGSLVYDPLNDNLTLEPTADGLIALNNLLESILQPGVSFSKFIFSNIDIDHSEFGLDYTLTKVAELVNEDDKEMDDGLWAVSFKEGNSSIEVGVAASPDEYRVRPPLFIGIGKIEYSDPEAWRLAKLSAEDTEGNALNPATIFRLLNDNSLLQALNEDKETGQLIDFLKDNVNDDHMGEIFSSSRSGSGEIFQIVLHFSSYFKYKHSDPYILNDWFSIFTTDCCEAKDLGAHYLIDREGTIYQLVEEVKLAQHVGGQNSTTIGIELMGIGTKSEMQTLLGEGFNESNWETAYENDLTGFTEAQYATLSILLDDIVIRNRLTKNFVGTPTDSSTKGVTSHKAFGGTHEDPGEFFDWRKIGVVKTE